MNQLVQPRNKTFPLATVVTEFALYLALFVLSFGRVGWGTAPVALVPVSAASWYFGIKGGVLTAILAILADVLLPGMFGYSPGEFLNGSGNVVGSSALLLVAIIVGRLSTVTRERTAALVQLEKYEKERQTHSQFMELLNEMTGTALEAENPGLILKVFVEHIGKLFEADDCFFASWDETNALTTPVVAYGSMKDIYPHMHFEPGEQTFTALIMEAGHPIVLSNPEYSSFISPKIASQFPSSSMLGLPLIVQGRKLGALILGYNKYRLFDPSDISRAELAAEQIALVLLKSQLLEEAHKQVVELTALHDVAIAAIQADSEDQLIERVTDIIGQNLFPDNFGIMLLDKNGGVLRPHPSYRFISAAQLKMTYIHMGEGVTGQVAKMGEPQRIGDVRRAQSYVEVDERTNSELCVPIKLKERVLGVINAESVKREAFSADDERLLVTLAGQLATAIEQLRRARTERKWLDQLTHSNDLIYSIAQITTQIEKALTRDDIIKTLGNGLHNIGLTCIMALHDISRSRFTINYTSLEPHFLEIVEKGLGYPLIQYTFSREVLNRALGEKEILYPAAIPNPEVEIQTLFDNAENPGIVRILQEIGVTPGIVPLRLPLVFEENLSGILWVWGKGITRVDLPIMSLFAKQIGISLERARLFQEMQSLALTDPLTCLHNRRNLFQLGRIEFSRAHRMERSISCMMLDLDHFKQINDNHGHPVGDQVLQEFANRCKNLVREIDLVGRYGGEEIIILLPETDLVRAIHVAERICSYIAGKPIIVSEQEIRLTVSIGVAVKDENTVDLETLIARADQAMYIAKHKGRNQVAVSK
ncbi:MAG TPA: sensor domain-containing diguanylate cyclase [Anaerolineales bacterium]|nr:sensor domain-containing diguanylate cyclase [Anaerolineales bacterium]